MAQSAVAQALEARKNELIRSYTAVENLINETVLQACSSRSVALLAVSKFQPSSDILALYNHHGVRHFGENYVQELIGKCNELPQDIMWHFIGGLQTGKCKDLAKQVPNLYAVEAIDSLKKCKKLDTARQQLGYGPILVSLQINTLGEEQKSGYSATVHDELFETIDYLTSTECKSLQLHGLMTIGSFAESTSQDEENADFSCLLDLRTLLEAKYNIKLTLSMGMSNDFVQAIKQGSDSVRVGSKIFGARPPKQSESRS